VFCVREGDTYYRIGDAEFALAPEQGRAGYDALLAELAAAGAKLDRVVHLWTLTRDRSARPGSSFYHHMQERGFFSLTLLAQALGDQPPEGALHVDVITNGAESRGAEATPYPEKATLVGPLKVIPQEFPGITTASLDVELPSNGRGWRRRGAAEAPLDALAARVFEELARPPQSGRTLLRGGERWRGSFERRSPQPRIASRLRDGGVYLITGGLGGIGLVVAEHLARTRKAKLALIGRSALPARDDWARVLAESAPADKTAQRLRSLERLERLGAEVLPIAADVANVEQMRDAVARVRARFGRLDGVFHAAGVLDDGLIQTKTQTGIEEVFAPKIQGALVLEQVLAGAGAEFVMLFSSTSSVLGAAGQVDYAAANAFLDAFAHSRRASRSPQWIAVNWGVWSDVGMGAEAARRARPDSESASPAASAAAHPLLGSASAGGKAERTYRAALATSTHWILDEHRTRAGAALIPGTGYIELARAVWAELEPGAPLELRDLFFLTPLAVPDGGARAIRTTLAADGALEVASVAGSRSEVHAVARVGRGEFGAAPALDLAAIRARCAARHTPRDERGICTAQEREHLAFGPRWRCLNEVWWGEGEALAALSLPAGFERELETFPLHPALLDLATGYGLELVPSYDAAKALFVPFSYRELRIHAPLAPRIFSWIRSAPDNHADKEIARFDVTLTDETGRVLVEIGDFAVKRAAPGQPFAEARGAAPEPALDAHLSPAERAFRRTLRAGIAADEGVAALERILAEAWTPQVIVSSIELDTLIAQVHAAAPAPASDGARFERPALASEYVAPRDALEQALAEIWQELLGIEKVGVQDDFFAVGGHSLIAVRLFAQIKKRLGVDRPISVLYEAPTIERFAGLVRGELEGAEGGAASARASFRFLVPMHTQANAKETPIFLVAGMFGNVLNLRHLADLLGKDRPFYAVQARGLYGGDEPHEDFVEMAADYLAEIRHVQPHGPYLFAGYSGGGICAYEMAQQVSAAGERVEALVLLDTPIARPFDRLSRWDKVRIHLQRFARGGVRYPLQWLEERRRWQEQQRRAREEAASQAFEFRSRKIGAAFYRALARYETRPYAGRVFLFRPPLQIAYRLGEGRNLNFDRDFIAPDNAWSRYVSDLVVTEVPGDHDSMVLEPSVRVLAEKIRAALLR
jgi:thioesterase domain-containing protein/NAD(P)-dependent dehydrogenase (short-subunit alcohol dehydrogenase family)